MILALELAGAAVAGAVVECVAALLIARRVLRKNGLNLNVAALIRK